MHGVPPQIGEVVDYYQNPDRQFYGPSGRCRLKPHSVVILSVAHSNDGSFRDMQAETEYMCCVVCTLKWASKQV